MTVRLVAICALVLAAWGLGFLMGGRGGSPSADSASKSSTASIPRPGRAAIAARDESGGVIQHEPSTVRRQPWTRDRLLSVGRGLMRESNIVSIVRRSIRFADELEASDFPLALEVSKDLSSDNDGDDVFAAVALARWTELDPRAAAEYLTKRKEGPGFFDIEGGIVWSIWGSTDPNAALAFAKGLEDPELRKRALRHIVEALARRDPTAALAFAKAHVPELSASEDMNDIIGRAAGAQAPDAAARELAGLGQANKLDEATFNWAKTDRASALGFARAIADDKVRSAALEGVYRAWFAAAPREAAAAMLSEPQNSPEFKALANLALTNWSKSDTAGAIAWAARLPPGVDLTAGLGYLGERAGSDDPAGGAKWLETLPAGGARDEAVSRYTVQVVEKDGAAAMEWAHTIGDSAKRTETMQRLTKDWFSRNPAAAYDWLQTNTLLTPEEKQEVLKR